MRLLAEQGVAGLWGLPGSVEFIRCETEQPVDDLMVGFAGSGLSFIQVKRNVDLSFAPKSPLSAALRQFVLQYVENRAKSKGPNSWDRPLDAMKDRIVLVTTSESSARLRQILPSLLQNLRNLLPDEALRNAAKNDEQGQILSDLMAAAESSWNDLARGKPSQAELLDFFSLLSVVTLDVEPGGSAEREAKDLLANAVLESSHESDSAWALLVDLCADLARRRSGADRRLLLQRLEKANIFCKAPRSYEGDIQRMREYSLSTLRDLRDLSVISIGGKEVKTQRESTAVLRQKSETHSFLIVGDPGAGKSGALHDFVERLNKEGRDFVFLAVDRFEPSSLGALRQEMNLEHDVATVLEKWTGSSPGFLVIDALDAARADLAAKALRTLIGQTLSGGLRWRVVASIRKYDLRYSEDLKRLFSSTDDLGLPTDLVIAEFAGYTHLNIPRLSKQELDEIGKQSPVLFDFFRNSPPQLQELLEVPFNLKLLAELLDRGVATSELTPIATQLELLEKYWQSRVVMADGEGDAREALLTDVCRKMVQARALRISRRDVANVSNSQRLRELLSSHVLKEWQTAGSNSPDYSILSFSHHILFDYAVARLLLRGTPEGLLQQLRQDPELGVIVRPSFMFHFRYLWHREASREGFWALLFQIAGEPSIPEISKIMGPAVAAELVGKYADLAALCSELESVDNSRRQRAEKVLEHVVGGLLAEPQNARRRLSAWAEFVEQVSRSLRRETSYQVQALLATLCEGSAPPPAQDLRPLGLSAQTLLKFAWQQQPRNGWLVIRAIRLVCYTFGSNVSASSTLLRRMLEPVHMADFAYEELPWLAREVKALVQHDPNFVVDIYRAAFAHEEVSTDPTPMGQSQILRMSSNRKQDFDHSRWELAESFPSFVREAPEHAALAMMAAIDGYISREKKLTEAEESEVREQGFEFCGYTSHIRPDFSSIWDSGFSHHDDATRILDHFFSYLDQQAEGSQDQVLSRIISVIGEGNRAAVVWRRLIECGGRRPESLGNRIWQLAKAVPILLSDDTSTAIGEFLKATFPLLPESSRRDIELTILSLPSQASRRKPESIERIRNRLLGCIPAEFLVTREARDLVEKLTAANSIPKNEPRVRFSGAFTQPYGEEEYLAEQGVSVDSPPNRELRELAKLASEFASKHSNSTPSFEEASGLLASLKAVRAYLAKAEALGVHEKQIDYAWGHLSEACERISKISDLDCGSDLGSFVRHCLIESALHQDPQPDAEYDKRFDEFQSWGGPSPRIAAAQGLANLANDAKCADQQLFDSIKKLLGDPVPAVRFQVALRLAHLYHTNNQLMWELIENVCRSERSTGVLLGLMSTLGRIAGPNPERVAALLSGLLNRVGAGKAADELREGCITMLAQLHVWRDEPLSSKVIPEIIKKPVENARGIAHAVSTMRDVLTHGPVEPRDEKEDAIRLRALRLVSQVLQICVTALNELEKRHSGKSFGAWPKEDQENARELVKHIDHVATELYFASGSFDRKRTADEKKDTLDDKLRRRFFAEATPLIETLAATGFAPVSHHLLELLENYVDVDQAKVFLLMHKVTREGQKGSYQHESLAADLIVRVVERYLAEYRPLFRENQECRRALIDILDIFVKAGWPSALRLTYRLEEIFR